MNRHEAEATQDEAVAGDITVDRTRSRRSSYLILGFTAGCVLIVAVFLLWSFSELAPRGTNGFARRSTRVTGPASFPSPTTTRLGAIPPGRDSG